MHPLFSAQRRMKRRTRPPTHPPEDSLAPPTPTRHRPHRHSPLRSRPCLFILPPPRLSLRRTAQYHPHRRRRRRHPPPPLRVKQQTERTERAQRPLARSTAPQEVLAVWIPPAVRAALARSASMVRFASARATRRSRKPPRNTASLPRSLPPPKNLRPKNLAPIRHRPCLQLGQTRAAPGLVWRRLPAAMTRRTIPSTGRRRGGAVAAAAADIEAAADEEEVEAVGGVAISPTVSMRSTSRRSQHTCKAQCHRKCTRPSSNSNSSYSSSSNS